MIDYHLVQVNITRSAWESKKALFDFTYASENVEVFKRKKEWFYKLTDMHRCLWFVKPRHEPYAEEAKERLEYCNQNGDISYSFGFKGNYFPEKSFYNSKPHL